MDEKNNKNQNQGQNNKDGNKGNKFNQTLLILLIAGVITVLAISCVNTFLNNSTSQEISYTDFISMLENGNVSKVVYDQDVIRITPKTQPIEGLKLTYYTGYIYDEDVIQYMKDNDVEYNVKIQDKSSSILDFLLVYIVPWVLIYFIFSFQLETVHEFHPKVSAILNITPDHLNRHYTMENYAAVKERIAANQTKDDFVVLNYDDEVLRRFGEATTATPVYFSRKHHVNHGTYLEGTMIKYTDGAKVIDVIDVRDMLLFGAHNHENVMAAAAICIQMGVPVGIIADTIRSFKAVEHRIEYVRTLDGVEYYNDSKGTNPDSTIKAIEAMPKKTILIAGGYDKHSEFDEMIKCFKDTIIELVLLGVTKDKIAAAAREQGFENIRFVETLKEAVEVCREDAREGQIVLLSPACASWDMFKSYEERGKLFKQYVNEL